jgi:glucoamylase
VLRLRRNVGQFGHGRLHPEGHLVLRDPRGDLRVARLIQLAAVQLGQVRRRAESVAVYLRESADVWNTSLERWMYVTDSDWCREYDVPGYYVRIVSVDPEVNTSRFPEMVRVKNLPDGQDCLPAVHLVSPDALALVRFGLRAPDNPRILATAKLIDALLKVETAGGPVWHRYNGDGYGEHDDGEPFDGTGRGRAWPLLTGERAHFELARGRTEEAERLRGTLESLASCEGLLPEQSWDAADLPERELFFGRPTGSAMPLVWAHAEYLKLLRSLRDGRVFDMPPQPVQRYQRDGVVAPRLIWRFNHKLRGLPAGKLLRIETMAPALVYWSTDSWNTVDSLASRDPGIGLNVVDLDVSALAPGKRVIFTFYWPDAGNWEGTDFIVGIEANAGETG